MKFLINFVKDILICLTTISLLLYLTDFRPVYTEYFVGIFGILTIVIILIDKYILEEYKSDKEGEI